MLARDLFVRCYSFEENQSEYLPSQGGNFDQMTQTHRRGAQEWQRQPPHPPGPYPSTAASRDLDPYPLQRAPAGWCGGGKTAGHSRFLGTVGAARDTERQRDRETEAERERTIPRPTRAASKCISFRADTHSALCSDKHATHSGHQAPVRPAPAAGMPPLRYLPAGLAPLASR